MADPHPETERDPPADAASDTDSAPRAGAPEGAGVGEPTFEIRDPELDAETLVRRIRERAQRRMAEGGARHLPPVASTPPVPAPGPPEWEAVLRHLDALNVLHDPTPQGPLGRHGPRWMSAARAGVRSALHPYHQAVLARQAQFNAHLANLLNALLPRLEAHEGGEGARVQEQVRSTLASLEARLEARLNDLVLRLESLAADRRWSELERGIVEQERRVGTLEERVLAELAAQAAGISRRLDELATELERARSKEIVRVSDLEQRLGELRQSLALHKGRVTLLLRELRHAGSAFSPGADGAPAAPGLVADAAEARPAASGGAAREGPFAARHVLDDADYHSFENRFRGVREEIRRRQEVYLPLFAERFGPEVWEDAATRPLVVDVGCGRGEFLELLARAGIVARGIDLNEAMVADCRARGLDVERAEAIAYLRGLADGSLGGIVCFQVIEHLSSDELAEFVYLCRQKLRGGGVAVFETVNPLNLVVSAASFYLDPTHVRQVHPLTLQFIAESAGFASTEIRYLAPVPDEEKLQSVPASDSRFQVINENVKRLNELLFAPQDYALVAIA